MSVTRTEQAPEKTAVLFPGLSPARHSRVADFLNDYAPAARMVRQVEDVLGYGLMEKYRTAEVYDWEVYQTAHLVTGLALADAHLRLARSAGSDVVDQAVICGQSFGSFAAAVFAGACELDELVRLLRVSIDVETAYFAEQEELACVFFTRVSGELRDALMQDVVEKGGGWLDLSVAQDRGVTAVSGTRPAVDELARRLKDHRGVVFYVMNRAEHCARMASLVHRLKTEVYADAALHNPQRPLLSDDGRLLQTADDVREDLSAGWSRPLLSEELYLALLTRDVTHIVTPASRGSSTDFGSGRFRIETLLPNQTLAQLRSASLA